MPGRTRLTDAYELGSVLGQGTYGTIFEASARRQEDAAPSSAAPSMPPGGGGVAVSSPTPSEDSGSKDGSDEARRRSAWRRSCAVKVFSLDGKSEKDHNQVKESFEVERGLLSKFEHPNILKMYEHFEGHNTCCLVLEFCRGGDLFSRISEHVRQHGGGFDEPLAKVLFLQMLHSVAYLHAQRIVHRDLKTENFLLLGRAGSIHSDLLKLCDFGSCIELSDKQPRCMEKCGTLSYTAPEVYANKGANLQADAWSLGVVLYVLIVGSNPFQLAASAKTEDAILRIKAGNYDQKSSAWIQSSSFAKNLTGRLITVDETKRASVRQSLRNPWLASAERPMLAQGLADPPGLAEKAPKFLSALWLYSSLSLAQRLALVACALAASEDDVEQCRLPCRALFLALDADEDGALSTEEFASGFVRLLTAVGAPLPAKKLEERAHTIDVNRSGKIEWVEFLAVALLPLSRALSQTLELAEIACRLLGGLPGPYACVSPPEETRSPGELLFAWASKEDPNSAEQMRPVAGQSMPTLACLKSVLASVRKVASNSSVEVQQFEQLRDPQAGEAPCTVLTTMTGLTVAAVNSELLLVCAESDDDRATIRWNEACVKQGQPHRELKLDVCIVEVGEHRRDAFRMLAALDDALSNLDDVRKAKFVTFLPRHYEVVVNSSGRKGLGLQLKRKDPFEFGLVIHSVDEEGPLKEWNEARKRMDHICPGHVIVEVCGRRGRRQILLDRLLREDGSEISLTILDLSVFAL